jgi:arabinose-5-phosphate isomerase
MQSPHVRRGRRVFDLEAAALRAARNRLGREFAEAVEAVLAALQEGRKLVCSGMGKSGHVAEKVAATFTSTGAPCVYLDCANAIHGDAGIVSGGDAVLLFSYSGETEEMLRALPAIMRPGARLIALTANPRSTLAREAAIRLDVRVAREACPLNLAPTASTTVMLAMGDALAMAVLEARGFTRDEFARFHPGGTLGRALLLRVTDVMRSGDAMAVVPDTATVLDTVRAMSRARCGAACVVTPKGRLAGIFTHGDFARRYQEDPAIGAKPVKAVMTRRPVTARDDRLAVDVVSIFEQHRIDDLVILDKQARPVGLVDTQDLARHRLI